jgi:dTDP-4-amino-4,6-dideoxygalactose transaminase
MKNEYAKQFEIKRTLKRIEFGEIQLNQRSKQEVGTCLSKEWISYGPQVKRFEEKWGSLFKYSYNMAMSSGTDAVTNLVASLYDFGAQRGDEVIVPALSFIATANAVLHAGFTPVFVDVDLESMNIDPTKIEGAITAKTRAIIAVHTMGVICDMKSLSALAKKHDLLLFEDACEAHGAKLGHTYVGKLSDGAAFSFFAAHLICCGEGGMVSTQNKKVADAVISTRTHGRHKGHAFFRHERIGYNSKMNDLEASIGLGQLEDFWLTFRVRRNHLYHLKHQLSDYSAVAYFNYESDEMEACPHAFSVVLKNKSNDITKLHAVLDKYNIHWKRNFGCIPTQHKAYEFMGWTDGDFPNAEHIGEYGIHVGVHQHLSTKDLDRMVKAFSEYFEGLLVK